MSYKNYQSNKHKKNMKRQDSLVRGKDSTLAKTMSEKQEEQFAKWNYFFRRNPQYFVEWYLGLTLYEYQRFWIYHMMNSSRFLSLAGRGTAKSFIAGLLAVVRCILYPGTTVVIASKTKKQANLVVSSKIKWMYDEFPNINREITKILSNPNDSVVEFRNGSVIKSVVSSPNSRGHRCNMLLVDESRQVSSEILDTILKPFLIIRRPPFTMKEEYSDYIEQPSYIRISSVGYKSEEWYARANTTLREVAKGSETTKALFWDYTLTLKHHIRSREQLEEDKIDMDEIFFSMELGNIPYGGAKNSFFNYSMFKRTVKRPWIPIRFDMAKPKAKNKYDIPRSIGEVRMVTVDCAAAPGSTNDLTSLFCFRLIPTKKGYKTLVVYGEAFSGMNTELQALRIKQIYSEFTNFKDGDVLVLDSANIGRGIYDNLTSISTDTERDIDYPPMKVMIHRSISDTRYKDFNDRAISPDAFECVYPIQGSASLNSDIASSFRKRLKSGLLHFLVDKDEQEETYLKKKNKDMVSMDDVSLKAYILNPNIQTSLLVNESISLEMSMSGENIKLEEKSGARKDRYSSVSYGSYVVGLLEQELLQLTTDDDLDTWVGALGVV